jgi:hypothetical protein
MIYPYKTINNIPYFHLSTIDEHGPPDFWGYQNYIVVCDNDEPQVADWHMENERRLRPIHRYCRTTRFSSILAQLTRLRGHVPGDLISHIRSSRVPADWTAVRTFLRKEGYTGMYNRIPQILVRLGKAPIEFEMTNTIFHDMCRDFRVISNNFYSQEMDRKYFPSIRYIVFKMLEDRGAIFNNVPFMKTKKKETALEELWNKIKIIYIKYVIDISMVYPPPMDVKEHCSGMAPTPPPLVQNDI